MKPTSFPKTYGKGVTPAEWRHRLMAVPPPARWAAARIVWWDFFGSRLVPERWTHLDAMIKHRDEVETEVLVEALVAIGYPRKRALSRTTPPPPRQNWRRKKL